MLFGMWAVIELRLLGALLAGLLVFQLVHTIAPRIERHMSSKRARWLAVVFLSASFFFLEITNPVLWTLPLDIGGRYAGTVHASLE